MANAMMGDLGLSMLSASWEATKMTVVPASCLLQTNAMIHVGSPETAFAMTVALDPATTDANLLLIVLTVVAAPVQELQQARYVPVPGNASLPFRGI